MTDESNGTAPAPITQPCDREKTCEPFHPSPEFSKAGEDNPGDIPQNVIDATFAAHNGSADIQTDFNPVPAPDTKDDIERIHRDDNAHVPVRDILATCSIPWAAKAAKCALLASSPYGSNFNMGSVPSELSAGEMAEHLRVTIDAIRDSEQGIKALKKVKSALEGEIVIHLNSQGLTKLNGTRLNITLKVKTFAKYVPEKFADIVTGLVNSGNAHTLYRCFSAKKLQEMFDAGGRFPEGLSLAEKEELGTRRI